MTEPVDTKKLNVFLNDLLFETPGGTRYTQDSPLLPTVWTAFACKPREQQELIISVNYTESTGQAAKAIRDGLQTFRKKNSDNNPKGLKRKPSRVSFIPGQIAVKVYFDELIAVILPLTVWWKKNSEKLAKLRDFYEKACVKSKETPDDNQAVHNRFPVEVSKAAEHIRALTCGLMLMRREIDFMHAGNIFWEKIEDLINRGKPLQTAYKKYIAEIPSDFMWLIRISGTIYDSFETGTPLLTTPTESTQVNATQTISQALEKDFQARNSDNPNLIETKLEQQYRIQDKGLNFSTAYDYRKKIVQAFLQIFDCLDKPLPDAEPASLPGLIWSITRNRPVKLAISKSALTVKADAAKLLFDISCKDITWAIIDSGIDTMHPAFKSHETGEPKHRIVKTLDFTELRRLLDIDIDADEDEDPFIDDEMHDEYIEGKEPDNAQTHTQAELDDRIEMRKFFENIARNLSCNTELLGEQKSGVAPKYKNAITYRQKLDAMAHIETLRRRIASGQDINWNDFEKIVTVENPETPTNDHGTHVAGILGADWIKEDEKETDLPVSKKTRRMRGMCPDIKLIDVRVFNEQGLTDEFELIAAVQYLRWMNEKAGYLTVHGANLSLSLVHEVRRFACGKTPICIECDDAVSLGMVMVAAAGNRGFDFANSENVSANDSFKSVSITDPGNAKKVITVGSTHRKRPHEYGVSYFSSRGPTGDGRLKPDLVAPGEKILGPTPDECEEVKDGTSMAAPHVSGAAAMLMARHSELIGHPEKVKEILCATATDLGRERYFQGHGLVDILRAIQSV